MLGISHPPCTIMFALAPRTPLLASDTSTGAEPERAGGSLRRRLQLLVAVGFLPWLALLPFLQERALLVAALLGVTCLGLLAAAAGHVLRRVEASEEALLALIRDIEHGRLSQLRRAGAAGELQRVEDGLLRLGTAFSAIVADVRTSAALVEQAGQQLARDQRDLATRTEQQAASLEETAASVQQLVSTVQQNARAAGQADQEAARVRSAAESGAAAMDVAVGTVGAIQADTDRVRELVAVIDGIAFQTNVLALNAAVEAARAGDQGRGFAVVASEVRRLAQRCAQEAREIRDLVETSATHVDEGVRRIRSAGGEMGGIVDGVRDMAGQVTAISAASQEQSTGLGEISRAVTSLEAITQSNARMVDEAARQAAELQERAASLSRSVEHFRLMQGTASEALELVARARAAASGRSREQFLRAITDPANGFHDRDMYVFALDRHGTYLAFGGNPAKVGTRVQDISGVDGQALLDAIVRQAEREPGWVEYEIVNPLTRRVEPKMSYVVKLGDLYVGCGVYKSFAGA